MIWCPYTDQELVLANTSPEHIFPLALGGNDQFVLPVCKTFNSKAGSDIDGVLANDPLLLMLRDRYDVRGHSRKRPVFSDGRGRHVATGEPLHVALDQRDGLKLWSPKLKEHVRWPGPVNMNFKISLDSGMRFVAKVALSAGYFAYGEEFRRCVKHVDFRYVMKTDPATITHASELPPGLTAFVHDRFTEPDKESPDLIRHLCEAVVGGSVVCLVPGQRSFSVAVGILGDYMGKVSVECDSKSLPSTGDFSLGHIIAVRDGKVHRQSFRSALNDLASASTARHSQLD